MRWRTGEAADWDLSDINSAVFNKTLRYLITITNGLNNEQNGEQTHDRAVGT